jgi:hypothetical protein
VTERGQLTITIRAGWRPKKKRNYEETGEQRWVYIYIPTLVVHIQARRGRVGGCVAACCTLRTKYGAIICRAGSVRSQDAPGSMGTADQRTGAEEREQNSQRADPGQTPGL